MVCNTDVKMLYSKKKSHSLTISEYFLCKKSLNDKKYIFHQHAKLFIEPFAKKKFLCVWRRPIECLKTHQEIFSKMSYQFFSMFIKSALSIISRFCAQQYSDINKYCDFLL